MKNKKHINESRKDWGGYYSDNSMGTLSWNPSTPEDCMTAARKNGKSASDMYRSVIGDKQRYYDMEQSNLGLQGDANVTNRRNLQRNNWINPTDDETPNSYSGKKGYARYDEPEIDQQAHSQRQQELQKTFNANDKKLRRMQKKAGVLNENTIRKIVEETLRRLIKEYEDDDLGDEYVDPDDWRSEEPSENDVTSILQQIQEKCNECGAMFKDLGENEFGVISRNGNCPEVENLLQMLESKGVIYNTGGQVSTVGPWHAKFRVIRALNK